jgi:hypothetical protein
MDPNQLLAAVDNYKAEVRWFLAGSRGSSTGAVGIDLVSEVQVLLDDLPIQAHRVSGGKVALPIGLEDPRHGNGTNV